MHIYVVISTIMLLLFLFEQTTQNRIIRKYIFFVASFLAVGLLAFRGTDVGGDTYPYCGYLLVKEDTMAHGRLTTHLKLVSYGCVDYL